MNPNLPSLLSVGRPVPFRSSTGATVVNPLDNLRSQMVAQQVQAAISDEYQGVPPSQCPSSNPLLASTVRTPGWGVNPYGFPYGVTLPNGPPGNECPTAATFTDSAPTFTRQRSRGQPRPILLNSTVSQSAFYTPGNQAYTTVSFLPPKVIERAVMSDNMGIINGPPGPCGTATLSAVIGGPGHKNQ